MFPVVNRLSKPRLFMKTISFVCAVLVVISLLAGCSKDSTGADAIPNASSGAGTGGSMARFTVAGNSLYMVSNSSLQVYDLSRNTDPKPGVKLTLGFGLETIFPYNQNLFIGTQTGMYIYDISQPNAPRQLSLYRHIVSCDPVVAQGNTAYVTLRSGTTCRGNTSFNSLDVIDVSNLQAPRVLKSYPMKNPHGLGIDGNLLFVCEGDFGLKVLDVSNPLAIKQLQFIENVRTYDVIPNRNVLIVTGKDGIYQYSYAEPGTLKLLSRLDFN
jgi:hypothetical protein